jgi:hypothetical protein
VNGRRDQDDKDRAGLAPWVNPAVLGRIGPAPALEGLKVPPYTPPPFRPVELPRAPLVESVGHGRWWLWGAGAAAAAGAGAFRKRREGES